MLMRQNGRKSLRCYSDNVQMDFRPGLGYIADSSDQQFNPGDNFKWLC